MNPGIYKTRRENLARLRDSRFDGKAKVLAERIGRSPSQVSQWFTGERNITEGSARRIEQRLNLGTLELDEHLNGSSKRTIGTIPTLPVWNNAEDAGRPRSVRAIPVVGTARMGVDGYYDELQHPAGHGDGWIDSYSADASAYALRVKGDSMHPAIRHGAFVVVEPNGRCVPGEYVVIALADGRKMVKELVFDRATEVVVESVNGSQRLTVDKAEIETMHSVAAVVAASKWRPA